MSVRTVPLPEPKANLHLVNWESEVVKELDQDDMMEELVGMAKNEFDGHVSELKKMRDIGESNWSAQWPPWKVAHSIKGLALSLGLNRLSSYAKDIETLKLNIKADDIDDIIANFEALFDASIDEVKTKSNKPK
mmetsp:Transcript_9711/g.24678  ORF Transcript_9711/g.24678 Transcript_9711/m.24678 type:complete len:134 (+) Transcript_9711:49-450(+)|eukprot:CAMPEP_0197424528 /NCGR_PEP_ID=MMETSP1170-20131217/26647_1 /TAXON_ID=54406 /ORGANISM="Sarcinochrysis sp, Strain CCMP770" /LENGTH=133 /DNA_ID=CAMNT_0042952013 /DNA_START=49 /DNA_END=450 /DNA_ORIENTATION=-